MKKLILCSSVTLAFIVYALFQQPNVSDRPIAISTALPTEQKATASPSPTLPVEASPKSSGPLPFKPTPSYTPAPVPISPSAPPPPPPAPKPVGQYLDGRYVGSVADAYYGNVQVQVSVQGGRIADVTFLQYPNDRRTSQYINSQAMPYLTQEAIRAQSANVDIVSGATDTSQAFQQSLSSALAQARNA